MTAPAIYAIGDIHGHLDKLREVHDWIAEDKRRNATPDSKVVHIGDLVDRGPDSAGVIAFLQRGLSDGAPWVVLKGNHDRMFTTFLGDPFRTDPGLRSDLTWLDPRLGGSGTLASFGVSGADVRPPADVHADAVQLVPEDVKQFLTGLPTSFNADTAIFVHAGIRPGIPLKQQREDDLLWIRRDFLDDPRDHGALIVHGHTAIKHATHHGNRVNIDSSAAYGGPLSAIVIEAERVWLIGPKGRSPLVPD